MNPCWQVSMPLRCVTKSSPAPPDVRLAPEIRSIRKVWKHFPALAARPLMDLAYMRMSRFPPEIAPDWSAWPVIAHAGRSPWNDWNGSPTDAYSIASSVPGETGRRTSFSIRGDATEIGGLDSGAACP